MYVVYQTLKANGRITLNQLRHLLFGDLLLSPSLIEVAVSVLASKSMFNCLSMYQIKMTKPDSLPNFHLDLRVNPEFQLWIDSLEAEHPEIKYFSPPIYARKAKAQ